MEKNINLRVYKLLDISVFIFMVFPFLFLAYLYMLSNGDIVGIISKDARLTLGFISAMTIPFSGFVCKSIKQEIIDSKDGNLILGKLGILLIAQILIFNIVTLALVLFIFLKVYKQLNTDLKSLPIYISKNISQFIGVFLILLLSLFCFILGFKLF